MTKAKQKTGGSVMGGPGLGAGVGKNPAVRKTSIPNKGGYNISPNSANRGKQGRG
jgi:hypothetical protein